MMHTQAPPLKAEAVPRAAILGGVACLHVLLLVVLASTGVLPTIPSTVLPMRLFIQAPTPPRLPPRIEPRLPAPTAVIVPAPDINLATPPPAQPTRAISRDAPVAHPAGHFGAATDSGLGLDVAAHANGGAGARGNLAQFEAAVRARVLAARHQPVLAYGLRDTCVVNYRVLVGGDGALAGFSIDPCAVPQINQAARDAISHAGRFPPPPDLGAPSTEVRGSMIFRP